jgi:hypothetical protein
VSEDEFRQAMNAASREDRLCILMHAGRRVIAVGLDSGLGLGILFESGGPYLVPLAELSAESDCL